MIRKYLAHAAFFLAGIGFLVAGIHLLSIAFDPSPAEAQTVLPLSPFVTVGGVITQKTAATPVTLTGYSDGCVYLVSGVLTVNVGNPTCTGGGGGAGSGTVSTSTAIAAGFVAITTGLSTIGNDSTFLFDTSADRLTFSFSSSTASSFGYASSTVLQAGLLRVGGIADGCLNIASGVVGGTGSACGGAGSAFAFTPTTYNTVLANSTSTALWLRAVSPYSLIASSTFATYASSSQLTNSGNTWLTTMTSAILLTGSDGLIAEYTGASCTNQFVRSLSALGASTCATVVGTDVDLADLTATDGTLTFSAAYDGQTARTVGLNLASPNIWTAHTNFTAGLQALTATTTHATTTGSLAFPAAAAPALGAQGKLALDTTSNNLIISTSSTGHFVAASATTTLYSFDMASTSPRLRSGGVQPFPAHFLPQAVTAVICKVTSGTSVVVNLSDGTNDTNAVTCTTTETQFALTSNNNWTARERIEMEVGTVTGAVDSLTVRWLGYRTAD